MTVQNGVWAVPVILLALIALSGCGWGDGSSHQDDPPAAYPGFAGGDPPSYRTPPPERTFDYGQSYPEPASPEVDTGEPKLDVSLSAEFVSDDELVWTAMWEGGFHIAVIEWNFGGAAPNIPETPIDWNLMDVWNIPLVPFAESPTAVSIKAIRGGQYLCEVTVTDYEGLSGSAFLRYGSNPDNGEAEILNDRIYAYYEQGEAGVGEEVLVTVTTGELPHPFQFLLNAGLVLDKDAEYVANSFNVGSPGGNKDFPDGIWALVDPPGFILGPDMLIQAGANPDDSLGEKNRFDFNVSPLWGNDVEGAGGDLFNFRVVYSEPGIKTLTFQQENGVHRTYYSGLAEGKDRFWDDCSNWHPGLQTSIIVE